jgi:hypothetical protein
MPHLRNVLVVMMQQPYYAAQIMTKASVKAVILPVCT